MLVMIVRAAIPVKEIDERFIALMFLIDLFLWSLKFQFGSVFKIIKLG